MASGRQPARITLCTCGLASRFQRRASVLREYWIEHRLDHARSYHQGQPAEQAQAAGGERRQTQRRDWWLTSPEDYAAQSSTHFTTGPSLFSVRVNAACWRIALVLRTDHPQLDIGNFSAYITECRPASRHPDRLIGAPRPCRTNTTIRLPHWRSTRQ